MPRSALRNGGWKGIWPCKLFSAKMRKTETACLHRDAPLVRRAPKNLGTCYGTLTCGRFYFQGWGEQDP